MPLKETLLVYLPNQPPPGWIAKATARFPGLEIRWKQAPMLTTGGLEPLDKVDPELLKGVTILAIVYPPADPAVIRDVRFVQMATAGSDYWNACPVFKDPAVEFCSGSGVHAYAPLSLLSCLPWNFMLGVQVD